jgi:N-acetylglutamate synthase-like GNAT family acetyltransferase
MLLVTGKIEDALDRKDMFSRVSDKIKQKQNEAVEIVEYRPEFKTYFRDLNYEWLNKYFSVEKADRKMLNNPEEEIINHGGSVYFAKSNNEIVGTAAMVKYDSQTYELAKMAVRENERGKQVGKKLAEYIIYKAREKKAKTLFLDTSLKLTPALNLYKKLGFEQVEFDNVSKYKRSTIRLALKL